MSESLVLTYVFTATLVAGLMTRFWLALRQIRHVLSHRDVVPAAFAHTMTLTVHQKSADYTVAKALFSLAETAWSSAVLLGWTLLGGLDLLNKLLLGTLGGGMAQQLAVLIAFVAVGGLLELPFTLWQTFHLEQRFGFNKMTWRLWLTDAVKGLMVAIVLGMPIAALFLWLMKATGSLWWLWVWSSWMVFNLLLMLVYPTFIAPLFNKFAPLDDAVLKARVTALMQRCGFAAKGLFVMDGSRRSAHANAYFTGFGASKRVVFYDTLLRQLNAGEVEAVLAHELGHFKHRHILKRMAMLFASSFVGFALLGWLSGRFWFYAGLGVQPALAAPNDAIALLLFLLATPVFGFFVVPLSARLSRHDEFEADAYAIAQTSSVDLSSALLKLYQDNASTLTPDPMFAKFYYSHPPASERLAKITATTAIAA